MSLETYKLSLLKEEYNIIHNAYWECHKIYWQMTSIFLPIILGTNALIIKDFNINKCKPTYSIFLLFFIWSIFFTLLTFWFLVTKYLRSWNRKRLKRLQEIESSLKQTYGNSYQLYNLYSKNNKEQDTKNKTDFYLFLWLIENNNPSFSKLNNVLYYLLLILISLIFFIKFIVIIS